MRVPAPRRRVASDAIRTNDIDRRATIAVAVQFAVNGAFFASFLPRLPELRDELGVSTGTIGVLLTVAAASGLLGSATVGPLIARFGTRRVLLGGGVGVAGSLVVVGVAGAWPIALIGLTGMFLVDVYVDVAMNLQGSWLSARRDRPIMNRLHGLWSLGAAAGGLIASQVAQAGVGLTVHLCTAAAILAVVSVGLATQLLRTDETRPEEASTAAEPVSPPARSTAVARFFVAGLTTVVIETTAISWAAFRITDDLGGAASTAAIAYVAVVAGMTVARFAGDHLAHRFGSDRLMRMSATLAMVALVVAAFVAVPAVVVAAFFVAGLGIAALTPRLYDLAAQAGRGSASVLGVLTAGIRTATIVAPAVIAGVASATSIGVAIAVATVVAGTAFHLTTRTVGAGG